MWAQDRFITVKRMQVSIPDLNSIMAKQQSFDEQQVIHQIKSISMLIDQEKKVEIAEQIAAQLTILRRDYLKSLEEGVSEGMSEQLQKQKAGIQKQLSIRKITKKESMHENRAVIDGKIMYIVLGMEKHFDQMDESIADQNWAALSEFIVEKLTALVDGNRSGVMARLNTNNANSIMNFNRDPILQSELRPFNDEELHRQKQESLQTVSKRIDLHESYYERDNTGVPALPRILKKMANESDLAHSQRVKDYMILLTDEQFTHFGQKIDVEDPSQEAFLLFYNEMLGQRAEIKRSR